MSSGGIVAIVIVAIVISGIVRVARVIAGTEQPHPSRRERRELRRYGPVDAGPSQRELELQGEVEQLRDRVKVLERIATDEHKPQRLAAEIESLRDQ